jgi:aldose 1-epimerase
LSTGEINDIVLGFDKVEDYLSEKYLNQYPWFGCAVGRVANRIKNAKFEIDGKEYQLSKNRGTDQLHGGTEGFDKKAWNLISHENSSLELSFLSKNGEEGFPGNLEVKTRIMLNNQNELSYEYTATTDAPTVVNLTRHEYFNLDNGEGTIEDQKLKIYASKTLDQDDNLTATGEICSVDNTEFDFRDYHSIGERMNKEEGYDKTFVVYDPEKKLKLVAEAFSEKSKTKLEVFSDQPVVHFYSGRWIPEEGKNNTVYRPFSGFCLETQIHPNAINIPHFPNTILRPDEIYSQKTIYRISTF